MSDILDPIREIRGKMWQKKRKKEQIKHKQELIKTGLQKSKLEKPSDWDEPIDFVVLWVDDSDPEWLAEKNKYMKQDAVTLQNNAGCRYRDWDLFHYWFRAVEKYAPWVHCVHLVTWGHVPKWLNLEHPKLRVVKHDEFIPKEFLPTFSSYVIELYLWRIKGLSEHFVLFNDDEFLNNPVKKENFFTNGLPNLTAIAKPLYLFKGMATFEHARLNNYGMVNSSFNIRQVMEKNPEKWFSCQYGDQIKYNIRAYEDGYISGMYFPHLADPMRVSAAKKCYQENAEVMDQTGANRFRTSNDIFSELFQLWEIFNGSFEPVKPGYYGAEANITADRLDYFENMLLNSSSLMVCVNDGDETLHSDYQQMQTRMKRVMEQKFPDKSKFEK